MANMVLFNGSTAFLTFNDDFNNFQTYSAGTPLGWDVVGGPQWANHPQANWDPGITNVIDSGTLPYNNELQWYVNPNYLPSLPNPFSVSNGDLNITAAVANPPIANYFNAFNYSSGIITSYHSFQQTYGYFEMRAQLPSGQGLLPAFWLLPADGTSAELDVMEVLGSDPTTLYTTAHSYSTGSLVSTGAATSVADTSAGFHTYAVDWEPTTITWYFDGKQVFQTATPADMNKPMYMLADVAVGGGWPGSPNSSTFTVPATMSIDYIKAYEVSPTVLSIATSGSGITNGSGDLNASKIVTLTVNMSGAVTVVGTPMLTLNDGGNATFAGGSGTNALTFSYTVLAGQNTNDLIVSSLNLNGATIKDASGNNADLSGTSNYNPAGILQIDTTPPVVSERLANDTGSSPSDNITSNPALTGSGDANALVTLKEGVTTLGTATANGSGIWSFTPSGLADGSHTVVASETDAAGNTSTTSLTLTLDTAAPTLAESLVSDTGSSSSDKITSNTTLVGSGDANALVTLKEGVTTLGTATANGSGIWSFTPSGLLDGSHTIVASETDAGGNTGTTSLTFTLDTTAPTVAISSSGGLTNQAAQTVSGTVDVADAGSTVTILDGAMILGTATVQSNGTWSTSLTLTGNGIHTLTAKDTDTAGNIGTSNAVVYTLNTGGPTQQNLVATVDNHATNVTTGHTISLFLITNEPVTVTDTPTLQLNVNEVATYASGSGGKVLVFTYTVQAGDSTFDLQATGLNLPAGATMQDAAGNSLSTVSGDLSLQINVGTPAHIKVASLGILRLADTDSHASAMADSVNSGQMTWTDYVNLLIGQVQSTTVPAVAVEATMYGATGTSAEITALTANFLPAQVANATHWGLNPQVYACEALGLTFAFGNENGGTAFSSNFGPSNSVMPNTTAGDAAFAAAASSTIFGSASTANLVNVLQNFVANWKGFYTSNGVPGFANATAAQIDLAARGASWGDMVGVALANNLGPLSGQTTNFLQNAAQGTEVYGISLASPSSDMANSIKVTGIASGVENVHLV